MVGGSKNFKLLLDVFFDRGFQKIELSSLSDSIDLNVGVFWETSVSFLKSVVLQLFPKYSQN